MKQTSSSVSADCEETSENFACVTAQFAFQTSTLKQTVVLSVSGRVFVMQTQRLCFHDGRLFGQCWWWNSLHGGVQCTEIKRGMYYSCRRHEHVNSQPAPLPVYREGTLDSDSKTSSTGFGCQVIFDAARHEVTMAIRGSGTETSKQLSLCLCLLQKLH